MNLKNPQYYINRELSWLSFNERVLEEAKEKDVPILEKLKFIAISSSNLDEFFMIRVASLKDQVNARYRGRDISGMTAKEQLTAISKRVHDFVKKQSNLFQYGIRKQLKDLGIQFEKMSGLRKEEIRELQKHFKEYIFPNLTPMAVDSSRPFPLILNKTLNIAVILDKERFVTVQVPSNIPRYHEIKRENSKIFVMTEEIIQFFIQELFEGQQVIQSGIYRITRNADLTLVEEEAEDLLKEIEKSIKERKWGQAVRLEIQGKTGKRITQKLKTLLEIQEEDMYEINSYLDYTFLFRLYKDLDLEKYKYPEYQPYCPDIGDSIFAYIKEKNRFLYHPFDSFQPVVSFLEQAAEDDSVLAIKQTLYRVSGDSPIVKALEKAAERGKQVTVIVELKARFDEENNIKWAKRLEKAGCHVIYGLVGYKVHSKITLIVRMEKDGIRRYVHLGTGNYNDLTAKVYTDISIFTAEEEMGEDASKFFNILTGYSDTSSFHKLYMSPFQLKEKLCQLVDREIEQAKNGQKAQIIAKMNSLVDQDMIGRLYLASQAGVQIFLIIRGICCLRPQIENISDSIHVISIVGEFLEHNRTFYFENGGNVEIYASSADWMPRNLYRRIELMFPIEEESMKAHIIKDLFIQLGDNVKARKLDQEGKYHKIPRKRKSIQSQKILKEVRFGKTRIEKPIIRLLPMNGDGEEQYGESSCN